MMFDTTSGASLVLEVATTDLSGGGSDSIRTGPAGDDVVLGGNGDDWIDTGAEGDDVVFGDNGVVEFNIETGATTESVLSNVKSVSAGSAGDDVILVAAGNDVVVAGGGKDLVNYVPVGAAGSDPANNSNANGGPAEPTQIDAGLGNNLVIGDDGEASFDTARGEALIVAVTTTDSSVGAQDFIYTGISGDDVVLGGSGSDWIDTGLEGDDIVIGDNGLALFNVENGVDRSVLASIESLDAAVFGDDVILVAAGDDVVVAACRLSRQ